VTDHAAQAPTQNGQFPILVPGQFYGKGIRADSSVSVRQPPVDPLTVIQVNPMSNRAYRLMVGLVPLICPYFDIPYLIFGLIAVVLLEGLFT
jgi:hypothetical protein